MRRFITIPLLIFILLSASFVYAQEDVYELPAIADGDTKVNPANEDFYSPRYFDHATPFCISSCIYQISML